MAQELQELPQLAGLARSLATWLHLALLRLVQQGAQGVSQHRPLLGAKLFLRVDERWFTAREKEGEEPLEHRQVARLFDQRGAQRRSEGIPVHYPYLLHGAEGVAAFGDGDAHPGRAQPGNEVNHSLFHRSSPYSAWR